MAVGLLPVLFSLGLRHHPLLLSSPIPNKTTNHSSSYLNLSLPFSFSGPSRFPSLTPFFLSIYSSPQFVCLFPFHLARQGSSLLGQIGSGGGAAAFALKKLGYLTELIDQWLVCFVAPMGRREFGAGIPRWLCGLVEESFFVGCPAHESRKKNEKNIFCLACCTSICPHCAADHRSHPLLQVRRYVYNDVVRLDELDKLIDCSFVQPYTINSAKVIFLKPRPQSRPSKGSANVCLTCDRILQEPFHFCSLSCKVDHFLEIGEDLSNILVGFDESEIAFSHFENLRVDSSDPLEDDSQMTTAGAAVEEPVHNSDGSPSDHDGRGSSGTKKNESDGSFPNQALSPSSNNYSNDSSRRRRRRKSQTPQRSHLS